jgi:hypothetical protein
VVKCSEVLQCSVGLRNKVSNIIRRHADNTGLLLIYILLLSQSFIFNVCMVVFRFNSVIYVFLLLCLIVRLYTYCIFMYLLYVYIFTVCLCIPSATLTEVFPCFFLSCKANTRARPALFLNFCVVLSIVCLVSLCVLFVCKCVLNCCHRVATQLQLINISYQTSPSRRTLSFKHAVENCNGCKRVI